MLDTDLAVIAATHYRRLRELGITVRKTIDLIIGTFCIAGGHALLMADRDFAPMAEHLGLTLV
jgi:predicted nucleic acid-binding protein